MIALTANALVGQRERCLESGMDDFLAKPIRGDQLGAVLEHWTTTAPDDGAPAPAPEVLPSIGASAGSTGGAIHPNDVEAAPAGRTAPVDPAAIERIRGLQSAGRPDILGELIELFLDHAPGQITALRDAAAQGAVADLRRVAHTMKGDASSWGATALVGACLTLERLAAGGTTEGAEPLIVDVERAFGAVRDALAGLRSDAAA